MLTESEKRFEAYCALRSYPCMPIKLEERTGRRPDYRVTTPGGDVICEVKQIEMGPWELQKEEELHASGRADYSRAIGEKVHNLIRRAAPQLRPYASEGIPCIIAALDLTPHLYLSENDIDGGMFGVPVFRYHLAESEGERGRAEVGHGGERQITEKERKYVSALAVMDCRNENLVYYHNPFASHPLIPHYFPHPTDIHMVKDGHPDKSGHSWFRYVGSLEKPT